MSIETRLIEAAKQMLGVSKVFSELHKASGISADSWRKVSSEKQRATSEMIEWACQKWPHFAFWISTGVLPQDVVHKTPEQIRIAMLKVDFEKLFAKEPINWTADETAFLYQWLDDERNDIPENLSTRALQIYLDAAKEKKLLKQVIEKESIRLKEMIVKPEKAEELRDKHSGAKAFFMSFEELIEFEKEVLVIAIIDIERCRAKKIS